MTPRPFANLRWTKHSILLVAGLSVLAGCAPHLLRLQSPDLDDTLAESESSEVKLVGDYAGAWGLNYMKVESVALVSGLRGTGGNPPPSAQKRRLLAEMQTHNVKSSDSFLASRNTAMVYAKGFIPPGAQKDDRFDVELRIPNRSETVSLDGGWLMPSRMRHMEVLGGELRSGDEAAGAVGAVLVDSLFEGDDDVLKTRGRVLAGGTVRQPRKLGLIVRRGNHSVKITALIASAINARFFTYDHGGIKRGVATARDDKLIELDVPPQYRHYVTRYIAVVRNLALSETPAERIDRLAVLQRQLNDPTSGAVTALRLEAIGDEAIPVLESALESDNPEVRFYAAEALAYLDQETAIGPLGAAAESEAAFRWHAITALAAMEQLDASDALARLFHANSAETRYGAFRALRARNHFDPLVKGQVLGKEFYYHVVSTTGEPMVHVSSSRRPEIVLFGHDQRIEAPAALFIGDDIMIKRIDAERVEVVAVSLGDDDNLRKRCSTRVDDVIRAIVEVGGGYSEVLQALRQAKVDGYLQSRLAIDALPQTGRRYFRGDGPESAAGDGHFDEPLPELFRTGNGRSSRGNRRDEPESEETASPDGLFGRMKDWFSG